MDNNEIIDTPGNSLIKFDESLQIAQDLPKRREAERRIEEDYFPEQESTKKIKKKFPKNGKKEDLPKRSEIPDNSDTTFPLQDLEAISPDVFLPTIDRWRIGYKRNIVNPYERNVLKGDYPILGDNIFFVFTGISDTLLEFRELPVPSGVSTVNSGSSNFFGKNNQLFFRENLFFRFELLEGDTAFKPPDWAIVATLGINAPTYLDVQERGVVNIDVRNGTDRTTYDFAVQELFFEYHLSNLSVRYDFISTKIGIQPFNSDFRGLIFLDSNLGARVFGDWDNNKWQYNLAFFKMLEKDINSEFNKFDFRDQEIFVANLYKEDFVWLGYTTEFSFHYNHDNGGVTFDENDFLVIPNPVGNANAATLDVFYLGWTSNGHIGRINVNHAFYLAFGKDKGNPLAGREVDIFGHLGALELSIDYDWIRPKFSIFYSSGDSNPTDGTARGFDTIFDKPNFVGSGFSFWNRQGIRLLGTGLVQRESLIPNLRSSKIEGKANFVNPGIVILNVGVDIEMTPKLRTFFNANYLSFVHTEPLEVFLQQPSISRSIGLDLSFGAFYRPLNNNNIIVTAGIAALIPGDGFEEILTKGTLFQSFINLILTY